jgi:hypothetical protein
MGPVAFLWPDDRPWSAIYDNTGPCGSSLGVSNRTTYPLSHDDAWNVAFYIAFDNGRYNAMLPRHCPDLTPRQTRRARVT